MPYLDIRSKDDITKQWVPIAYVMKDEKKTDMFVCANIDFDDQTKEPKSIMADEEYSFKPFFFKKREENQTIRLLIFGPQGSGKSYLVGDILDDLFENYESKDILIFARNDNDEPLDKPRICFNDFNEVIDIEKSKKKKEIVKKFINKKGKKYKPIRANVYDPTILKCPTESYNDSYLVFDDVERMKTKEATEYCHNLRCSALEVGRKINIDCVNILHNIRGGPKNSVLRDESNYLGFFPLVNQAKTKSFLGAYLDIHKNDIEKIMEMRGRSLILRNEFPLSVVGSKEVILL